MKLVMLIVVFGVISWGLVVHMEHQHHDQVMDMKEAFGVLGTVGTGHVKWVAPFELVVEGWCIDQEACPHKLSEDQETLHAHHYFQQSDFFAMGVVGEGCRQWQCRKCCELTVVLILGDAAASPAADLVLSYTGSFAPS